MKCLKIEAHIIRTEDKDKIRKTIVAFNEIYHLVKFVEIDRYNIKAIYEPKLPEDK
jgi:hypothetical protein